MRKFVISIFCIASILFVALGPAPAIPESSWDRPPKTYNGPFKYDKTADISGGEPVQELLAKYLSQDPNPKELNNERNKRLLMPFVLFIANHMLIQEEWNAIKGKWDAMSEDKRKEWLNKLGDQMIENFKKAEVPFSDEELNKEKNEFVNTVAKMSASEAETELPFDRISLLGIIAAFWLRRRGSLRSPFGPPIQ